MEENQKFIQSYDWNVIKRELFLSIFLLSILSTMTTFVKENNHFQWIECLSISVTSFLIIYIGLYGHEKAYKSMVNNLRTIPLKLRIILVLLPVFVTVPIVFTLFYDVSNYPVIFQIAINFLGYFVISLLLAIIMFYIAILFFD
ncbi:MAG: hypothetical protein D8H99_60415 [Streptococcus sp.]|nr:MAG: hypothetical protein D8H99_60415 [Streptococcus sp.]